MSSSIQNFELLILDDCSTDNSVEVIKSIIGEDKRFKLFQNEENKKAGYTKRRLVELASSEICGFFRP
ncbi:glycosyltransferase [Empedobacter falsenii]|uniref:glycosyltransferase n=1 Tax=Empedobacter falsenii TaxID=343874 RepID=UPI002581CD06|nr:glycosyltransferase [Empedobacter falsenii]